MARLLGVALASCLLLPVGVFIDLAVSNPGVEQVSSLHGYAVRIVGDVNGDGRADVVVGQYSWDQPGPVFEVGRAYLYLGKVGGIDTTPAWTSLGDDVGGGNFGVSVAGGDVNGDGRSDVVVGATSKAFLYNGTSSGLTVGATWTSVGDGVEDSLFGYTVAIGDINGDGFGDVIVGAPGQSEGKIFVYFGSAGGPAAVASQSFIGEQVGSRFGDALAIINANGDAFSDLLVGAPAFDTANADAGKAYLYLGSAAGLEAAPIWTSNGDDVAGANFGWAVANVFDVNGDSFQDAAVGAPGQDNLRGRVFVFPGGAGGLGIAPIYTRNGDALDHFFGAAISTAGDVDADGRPDLLVGAPRYKTSRNEAGRVYLFLNSSTGLDTASSWETSGDDSDQATFGYSLHGGLNVDGVNGPDFVVGAPGQDSNRGRMFLYLSSTGIPPLTILPEPDEDDEDRRCSAGGVRSSGTRPPPGLTALLLLVLLRLLVWRFRIAGAR